MHKQTVTATQREERLRERGKEGAVLAGEGWGPGVGANKITTKNVGQYSILHFKLYKMLVLESRGRILGRNWDKSLKSFLPSYSQPPLLTDFHPHPPPLHGQKWFETGL